MRKAVTLSSVVLMLSCSGKQTVPIRSETATRALVGSFETVAFSKASLLANDDAWFEARPGRNLLDLPFDYLRAAIDSLQGNSFEAILHKATGILAGVERFQPPTGLGLVVSTRCYVVLLTEDTSLKRTIEVPTVKSSQGVEIWQWSAALGEYGDRDPRVSNLAAAQTSIHFIVCNDLQKLHAVLETLTGEARRENPVANFRNWTAVTSHDLWIYRKYRIPAEFPMAAGTSDILDAEAAVFFTDAEAEGGTLLLWTSTSAESPPYHRRQPDPIPALTRVDDRTWQTKVAFESSERAHEVMFGIMGLLGFAVFV